MPDVLREPFAAIKWPLGDTSPDMVRVSYAVNAHPTVTFTTFSGKDAVTKATSALPSEMAELMGEAQRVSMGERSSADTNVIINDGVKELNLSGFMTGPAYMMNRQQLQPGFGMAAFSAVVSNLDLGIYSLGGDKEEKEGLLRERTLVLNEISKATRLEERLWELTEAMILCWENNRTASKFPVSDALRQNRHLANKRGSLDMWLTILAKSNLPYEWLSIVSNTRGINLDVNRYLIKILRGSGIDFQNVIDTLCQELQLLFIPDITGESGKLVDKAKAIMAAPTETKIIAANSILLSGDSSGDLLPVQQVMVETLPNTYTLVPASYQANSDGGMIVGGWPQGAQQTNGNFRRIRAPFYLEQVIKARAPALGRNPIINIPQVISEFKNIDQITGRLTNDLIAKMVEEYAKSVYVDKAIGPLSASLAIPLDLSYEVGNRYSIATEDGPVFRGFLTGVTHALSRSGSTQALTTLNFTHTEFGGYNLPGL